MGLRFRLINRPRRLRSGFTLFEAVMAAAVLSIAVFAFSGALTAANTQSQIFQQTAMAVALGRELLDEVTSAPLANPSTGTTAVASTAVSGNRSGFNYAGAYNLYSDAGASLPLINGTIMDVTTGQVYKRSVTVTLGAKPSVDSVSPSTDFGLVTVTVTTPLGQKITLQRVLCNYTFTR